jgi:acetyltransferase-like isoleucine patch superfamily enzyme
MVDPYTPKPLTEAAQLDNARVGEGTFIEPDVTIGFRYHERCGPARLGRHCVLRKGTIIYGDVTIGDYFQSCHYAVIRAKVRMGDYCTVMNHSMLEGLIRMGNGVRIMSHVYIPSRTWFGDHVFVGPNVTFLNDRYPGRVEPMTTPNGATIEDHVMIGGGSTILPGITIGQQSFIAAGAVVNRDVPPHSLVVGVPGRIEPLSANLDRPNAKPLTVQPRDLWHPAGDHADKLNWPPHWPEKF